MLSLTPETSTGAWGGVVLDKESPDYTILETYMSTDVVLAGKGSGSSSVRDKLLYIGTTQSALDTVNASSSVSRKIGQITRINGGAAEYFSALDNGRLRPHSYKQGRCRVLQHTLIS